MRMTHFHSFLLMLGSLAACSAVGMDGDTDDDASSGTTTSSGDTTTGTSSGSTSGATSSPDTTAPAPDTGSEEESTSGGRGSESGSETGSTEESGGSAVPGDCITDLASADFGLSATGWAKLGDDRQDPEQEPSATPGGARAKNAHLLVSECGFVLLAENDGQWAGYRAAYGKNFQRISDNVVLGQDPHDVQLMDGTVLFILTTPENQDYLYQMPAQGGGIVQVLAPDDTPQQIFDFHVRGENAFLLGWDGFNQLYQVPAIDLTSATLDRGEPIGMMGRSKSVFEPWTDDILLVSGSPSQRLDLLCVEDGQALQSCMTAASAGELHSVDARIGDWLVWFDANADVMVAHNPATDATIESPLGIDYRWSLASHVHGNEAAIVLEGPDSTALYRIGGFSGDELVTELIDTQGTGLRMIDVWFNDAAMLVVSESSDSSGQISLFGRAAP